MKIDNFYKVLSAYLGFYLCLSLNKFATHDIILASALTGLLGSFFPIKEEYKAIIYTASFAAMNSRFQLDLHVYNLLIPVILVLLFEMSKNWFMGFGGKLGSIAFFANGIVIGALFWMF